eukprot:TRINITY_DN12726_c0_g1_i1.p1 TRINITY_DN12726_c0_g1~~TRINITY_DN12726_c0_g1_i1.p1  ORF type:complete len:588 (+),score=151.15 TRINITY_DN12726_c0_g1_i1:203-1966(+)
MNLLAIFVVISSMIVRSGGVIITGGDWREPYYDPNITENSVRGTSLGRMSVLIYNDQNTSISAEEIYIGGVRLTNSPAFWIDGQMNKSLHLHSNVCWWRANPIVLEPGQHGSIQIGGSTQTWRYYNSETLTLHWNDGTRYFVTVQTVPNLCRISSLVVDATNQNLLVYIRNEHPVSAFTLEGLWVNGVVNGTFSEPILKPHGMVLATFPFNEPITTATLCNIQLFMQNIQTGDNETVADSLRIFPNAYFPIGFKTSSSAWNAQTIQSYSSAGFDTFLATNETLVSAMQFRNQNLRILAYPGNDFGNLEERININMVNEYAESSSVSTWMIQNLPDNNRSVYHSWETMNQFRATPATQATVSALFCATHYPEWAQLVDILCTDHFSVEGTNCDGKTYFDRLEIAGFYARAAKRNAEPGHAWAWSELYLDHAWIEPSIDEIRSQLYFQLAQGIKGVLWWSSPASDQLADVSELNTELSQISKYFLYGDISPSTLTSTTDSYIQVETIVSPMGMVMVVNNLDYYRNPFGYDWITRSDVAVTIEIFEIFPKFSQVLRLEGSRTENLKWQTQGNLVTIALGDVDVGAIVLIV